MGIFIFLPRIVMNNSTRNFSNSSNAQNSSSFKDKLRKLTTGVALAGTLLMGTACENKSSTTADEQKDKVENAEVKADNQDSELSDIDFDKEAEMLNYEFEDMQIKADSIANLEEAKRIEAERKQLSADIDQLASENKQLASENKQLASENKQLAADIDKLVAEWKAIEKNNNKLLAENKQIWLKMKESLSTVTKEQVRSSEEMQDAIIKYVNRCKKNWYQPGQHVQSLMSSINR